jgi:hypothetical protein
MNIFCASIFADFLASEITLRFTRLSISYLSDCLVDIIHDNKLEVSIARWCSSQSPWKFSVAPKFIEDTHTDGHFVPQASLFL